MKVVVINNGARDRTRAGHEFLVGEQVAVDLTPAALRAIRATRGLDILVGDEAESQGDDAEPQDDGQQVDISQMTVKDVQAAVDEGTLDPAWALEQEKAATGRSSLIDSLERTLEGRENNGQGDGSNE